MGQIKIRPAAASLQFRTIKGNNTIIHANMVCINSKQANKIIFKTPGSESKGDTEEMFIIKDLQKF
jgi:hypothetical protein